MKRRIGILLTGCGAYDGSDAHEAVLSILAVQRAGHEPVPLALEADQFHTVDHTTAQEVEAVQPRNQLVESARLVRGKIYSLKEISPKLLEGIILVGGQGAVKNLLSGFGTMEQREPTPELADFLRAVHAAGGVIAAISLAEFVVSEIFGAWPDGKGCFDLAPTEVLVDEKRRLLLTPGFTQASSTLELMQGIEGICNELLTCIEKNAEDR
jgi:enhancing lycopene biosynthesis protein 2